MQNPCPYQRLCISADTGKRVLKILKSQCYHLEDGNQCPAYVSTLSCEHRCGVLSNVCKKLRARSTSDGSRQRVKHLLRRFLGSGFLHQRFAPTHNRA